MTILKYLLWGVLGIIVVIGIVVAIFLRNVEDPFLAEYQTQCATCHGEALEGTALGPALVGRDLAHGDTVAEIMRSITNGFPQRGMPNLSPARRKLMTTQLRWVNWSTASVG